MHISYQTFTFVEPKVLIVVSVSILKILIIVVVEALVTISWWVSMKFETFVLGMPRLLTVFTKNSGLIVIIIVDLRVVGPEVVVSSWRIVLS